MPVSYTVSNVGKQNEPPPPSPKQKPYQDQGYYGPIYKTPHPNQGYNGSINMGSYQDQDYYGPVNSGDQDYYYGPANRGSYYQDQGYYGSVNMSPSQNQGYYGSINNDPYYQDRGYYGPLNRIPNYQDSDGYESDLPENYQDHGFVEYGKAYISHGSGKYFVNNPQRPYNMAIPREQSQISDTTEWKETPEAHVYKVYLPGVNRNDVEVEVEEDIDRILNIKYYRSGGEYSGHRVQEVQSIMLPYNANTGSVKANMENGVLTITIGKVTGTMKPYYVRDF